MQAGQLLEVTGKLAYWRWQDEKHARQLAQAAMVGWPNALSAGVVYPGHFILPWFIEVITPGETDLRVLSLGFLYNEQNLVTVVVQDIGSNTWKCLKEAKRD